MRLEINFHIHKLDHLREFLIASFTPLSLHLHFWANKFKTKNEFVYREHLGI